MLLLSRVIDRVKIAQQNSDSEYFDDLLLFFEALLKTTTAAMVAAVEDDPERHRYRLECKLVRASGLGDWAETLRDSCTGPASSWLNKSTKDLERKQFTERDEQPWKKTVVTALTDACAALDIPTDKLPQKIDVLSLFDIGVLIRNKTKAHGAKLLNQKSNAAPLLHTAFTAIYGNLCLYDRPWVHLHRNYSGRYKVSAICKSDEPFAALKTSSDHALPNGVYLQLDRHILVPLIRTDSNLSDFFLPNGGFTETRYEVQSFSTGRVEFCSSLQFLGPTGQLPPSETEGSSALDVVGEAFSNAPPPSREYVRRETLEKQLHDRLLDANFPLITLAGRGGIGKTSLALAVIQNLCKEGCFNYILWFSARDIDLLPQGPKTVSQKFQRIDDVARQFAELVGIQPRKEKGYTPRTDMQGWLAQAQSQRTLFVFDNFETVQHPKEFFEWLSTHIRLPNKILITTRTRTFTGDFKIDVAGMSFEEADQLITATAVSLGIDKLLTLDYRERLFGESGGHPYVIKILLGEVARAGRLAKVERIMGGSEAILNALFDRTYSTLTPSAQRVYLSLCAWNSIVSQIELEAVLLRPEIEERLDVGGALDELEQFSMIELEESSADATIFVRVPLASMLFGQKRIEVSPYSAQVRADADLLQWFGAAQGTAIRHGFEQRLIHFVKIVSTALSSQPASLDRFLPILETIGQKYPLAYYRLANLHHEREKPGDIDAEVRCLEKFLQLAPSSPLASSAWKELAQIRRIKNDELGELHALVAFAKCSNVRLIEISSIANRLNSFLNQPLTRLQVSEKKHLLEPIARVMQQRIAEADADDCSRLGWLLIHLDEPEKAGKVVMIGLEKRPRNEHLQKLKIKLREFRVRIN